VQYLALFFFLFGTIWNMQHYLSFFFAIVLSSTIAVKAQAPTMMRLGKETPSEKEQCMARWKQDRFGMFIHFGLYAIPARHEWVKTLEKIPDAHYDQYFQSFHPERYDPNDRARQAKEAGMRYVVITTKHNDGFCLFDSQYTEHKSTNLPEEIISTISSGSKFKPGNTLLLVKS
jgi:alpha-L-fucosidase